MCGRRKIEKEYPDLADWGDMPLETVIKIADQVRPGTFVQFHWNGEPLLYPHINIVLQYFRHCYTGLDTNGKLLLDWTLYNLDTITISVIPDDPEGEEQLAIAEQFLHRKGANKPKIVVFRLLGEPKTAKKWQKLAEKYNAIIAKRVLHDPMGSFNYEKPVTIPEAGVCLEVLHKLAIDRYGDVYPCVRFNPHKYNLLGNVNDMELWRCWEGMKRAEILNNHITGNRDLLTLCGQCDFWGIPTMDT